MSVAGSQTGGSDPVSQKYDRSPPLRISVGCLEETATTDSRVSIVLVVVVASTRRHGTMPFRPRSWPPLTCRMRRYSCDRWGRSLVSWLAGLCARDGQAAGRCDGGQSTKRAVDFNDAFRADLTSCLRRVGGLGVLKPSASRHDGRACECRTEPLRDRLDIVNSLAHISPDCADRRWVRGRRTAPRTRIGTPSEKLSSFPSDECDVESCRFPADKR